MRREKKLAELNRNESNQLKTMFFKLFPNITLYKQNTVVCLKLIKKL